MDYIRMQEFQGEASEQNISIDEEIVQSSTDVAIIGREDINVATTLVIPEVWRRRRRQTASMIFLNRFLQGFEFTMVFTTLWWYVNNEITTSNIPLSYGIIGSGRFVVPLLLGTVVTRWFDVSRKLRSFTLVHTRSFAHVKKTAFQPRKAPRLHT